MTAIKRFWIGGGGALLPLLITLIGADLAVLIDQHDQLSSGMIIGAGIRYLCLFILGGIVAALHTDERKPLKLVQLGIAAPALVTSYISVGPVSAATNTLSFQWPGIVSSAYAAEAKSERTAGGREIVLAGDLLGDIFKGWSKPLDRSVKKAPKNPQKAAADAPAKRKSSARRARTAAKPSQEELKKRRRMLIERRQKIEQELKTLERQTNN